MGGLGLRVDLRVPAVGGFDAVGVRRVRDAAFDFFRTGAFRFLGVGFPTGVVPAVSSGEGDGT